MALPRIQCPEVFDTYLADSIVKDLIATLNSASRGRTVLSEVANAVLDHDMDNDDAVDFFEAALATMAVFDNDARRDRIDMFGDSREARDAYNDAFDAAVGIGAAVVAARYDDILRCAKDGREEDGIIDNAKAYKQLRVDAGRMVKYEYDDRDDRRSRRNDRDDRRSNRREERRDDRRGDRDRGNRRGGKREESIYSHRAKNVAGGREEEPVPRARRTERAESSAPVRSEGAVRSVLRASANSMPLVRGAMPSLQRNSVAGVFGVEVLSNGDVSHVYTKENEMEPYAQHELRAFIDDREGLIVPSVDFRITPELIDPTAVNNNNNVYIHNNDEPVPFSRHGWCNINIQATMSFWKDNRARMLVARHLQSRDMCLTAKLSESIQTPASFDDWHKLLTAARAELKSVSALVANGSEDYTPSDVERMVYTIGRLEDDLLFLLIQYMAIILPAGSNFVTKSFMAAWPELSQEIKKWGDDEDNRFHDCAEDFKRMEREYLKANYRYADVQREEGSSTVTVTVESTALCVYYRGAVFNLDTCLDTYGQYFQIEHSNVPDLFTACSRLLRYRNSRMPMANVYIFDSTGAKLILTGGDLDGGRCCMLRPADENQPFTVA